MARISILIPHYKTWKMSFYAIHQVLKHRGRHQVDIVVVDNNPSDGTVENLKFFGDQIKLLPYPSDRMQSHGIAYDFAVPHLRTELFVTMESDSFPTDDIWLDWVEQLEKEGYDSAGSCLDLSGGNFVHTAGAFYKKSVWQKAKRYVDEIQYKYFPNVALKDGHACHLMVHNSVLQQFIENPGNLIEVAPSYLKDGPEMIPFYLNEQMAFYQPIAKGVFHQGMGNRDESYYTYAHRNVVEEREYILIDNSKPLLWRLGYEPGQFMCYWMLANKHRVYDIPTETVWLPGRQNQQQAYTKMENGFTHLWAVTAYNEATNPELRDIIDYKKNQMEELYNSIPKHQRI